MTALPLKALSVRQPWAWAIVHGGKDVENRSAVAVGKGNMRAQRIAIHAAKGMTRDEYEDAAGFMRTLGVACPRPDALIRGAIIGAVTVEAIVKEHPSPWFFGPRGLVLSGAEPVPPIAAQGALGFFYWDAGGGLETPLPWMVASLGREAKTDSGGQPDPGPLFAAREAP